MNDQHKSKEQLIEELQSLRAGQAAESHHKERLMAVLQVLPDLAFIVDEDGLVLEAVASTANEGLLYKKKEHALGKTIWNIFPKDNAKALMETVHKTINTGAPGELVYFLNVPQGPCWFEGRSQKLENPINGKQAVIWLARDITQQQVIKNTLIEKNNLLNSVIEEVTDIFFVKDLQGHYKIVNQACLDFLQCRKEAIIDHDDFAIFPKEMAIKFREADQKIISDAVTKTFDEVVHTPKGNIIVMTTKGVYRNNNNEILGIFGLVRDISERIEKQQKLEIARNEAQAANEAKSVFLSRMSHELRTPLHAILGFSQIQKNMFNNLPDQLKECNDEIISAGQHLLSLVNDILDIAHIEQKKLSIELEPCDLNAIMSQSVNLVKQLAKGNSVSLFSEACTLNVLADKTRLKQVLINVLTNAIKYNRAGGTVTLRSSLLGKSRVQISIQDTGVGICKTDQAIIFDPLTRLKYAEEMQIEGSGIGLSLCKSLLAEMKGDISVVSDVSGVDAVSEGSTFHITLPFTQLEQDITPSNSPAVLSNSNISVLYIEDDEASSSLLKMMFRALPDSTLSITPSAEQAIILAKHNSYQLIIIDINLPGMDGINALKILKKMHHLKPCKIIALSADALTDQIDRALSAGFDQYLTKPVDITQLIELIKNISQA